MDMIDIEAEQRLEDNQRIMKELGSEARNLQVGMPPPVKIVAGNKCDLKDARAISARDGLEYARKHGCGFMETSAREIVNIEETFARMSMNSIICMILVLTMSTVIVRRVVEARRQHYQSQQLEARMGSSTARTPALTVSERQATNPQQSKDGQRRRGGFPLFSGRKDASKRVSFAAGSNKEGGEQEKPPKNEGDDDDSHSWWRRLICV